MRVILIEVIHAPCSSRVRTRSVLLLHPLQIRLLCSTPHLPSFLLPHSQPHLFARPPAQRRPSHRRRCLPCNPVRAGQNSRQALPRHHPQRSSFHLAQRSPRCSRNLPPPAGRHHLRSRHRSGQRRHPRRRSQRPKRQLHPRPPHGPRRTQSQRVQNRRLRAHPLHRNLQPHRRLHPPGPRPLHSPRH